MIDSLVRVSRRDDKKHFVRVSRTHSGRNPARDWTPLSCTSKKAWHVTSVNLSERHCFLSFPFQQFQVLFNSLFKVLFIFPSRYLFAIGLPPIFSFRWNLPPSWSCNPKQLDSLIAERFTVLEAGVNGAVTLLGVPFQGTLPAQLFRIDIYRLQLRRFSVWAFPASLAVTRGILVSFFSSAY